MIKSNEKDAMEIWLLKNPLKKWRKEKGWSQNRLASYLSLSSQTIYMWETGGRNPVNYWTELTSLMQYNNEKKLQSEWRDWREEVPGVGIQS